MKTTIMNTLAAALLTGAVAVSGLTACSSSDDNIAEEPTPVVNPAQPQTYHVSFPATIGSDGTTRAVDFDADGTTSTSTFKTTDKIYVYNETQGLWATDGTNAVTLTPAANAQQTTLDGTLQFVNNQSKTPAEGDVLHLYYNMNHWDGSFFYYSEQTGSASGASARDFAEATMKIKSIEGDMITLCQTGDDTKTTAEFENLQSMFRQTLTFKSESGATVTPSITSLTISSKNTKLILTYQPLRSPTDVPTNITIANPVITDGNIYLALRFVGSDGTDALTFTAQDSEGNIYECTKNAPSGGFQNGKYYHGSMTMAYTRKVGMPEVSGTGSDVKPNINNRYEISNAGRDIVTEISGTSDGYRFRFWQANGATVTLKNLHATYHQETEFIWAQNINLNVVLDGDNSITSTGYFYCISTDSNYRLEFSGNGRLKLTVPSNFSNSSYTDNAQSCGGIWGKNCKFNGATVDPSVIAADGYTVTRSARDDSVDGYYSWTYTVAPKN